LLVTVDRNDISPLEMELVTGEDDTEFADAAEFDMGLVNGGWCESGASPED
jgi:hypothetical protein